METARCRAFVASAETGTFSAAAEQLGYTPSGVNQLVTALEDELQLKLMTRTKKGVTLTPEGEALLPVVRKFLSDEKDIYDFVSEIRGLSVGSVRIASYPSISTFWLPRIISAFEDDYPNIEITIMEGISQEIIEWLNQGEADIAFFAEPETYDFEWLPLAEDRMIAVLPTDHPLAESEAYPIRRCEKDKFIMPALGHDVDVEALFRKHKVKPNIRFSTLENVTTLAMVKNGLGVSIMNELCTAMWDEGIVKLPLSPAENVTMGIALPNKPHHSAATTEFVNYAVRMLTKADVKTR